MRSVLLALGLAFVAVGVANVPSAGAVDPPSTTIKSAASFHALDSNRRGDVYVLAGNGGFFQEWDVWRGGWIKNAETKWCLTSGGAGRVRTFPCLNNARQSWRWEFAYRDETYAFWTIRNAWTGQCLVKLVGGIFTAPCNPRDARHLWVAQEFRR